MVHIPHETVRFLRQIGVKADYLAKGESPFWNRCDFRSPNSKIPFVLAVLEFFLFWKVVAKYEIIHLHFGLTMSRNGWELPWLKKMERKVVIHFRGCEIRDYHLNNRLHPTMNICQECDYNHYCISAQNKSRIKYVTAFGDAFLVTTPDLKDFFPKAVHMPFFCSENRNVPIPMGTVRNSGRPLRILHWTNHPGIEGTNRIKGVIERLKKKGYSIEFIFLKGVSPSEVREEIAKGDLAIGKMKMGYYANSQIEAMASGLPVITWIREDLLTDEILQSGFIISHLDDLEQTVEFYLKNPEELEKKRRIAKESIMRLHDNNWIANQYKNLYEGLIS